MGSLLPELVELSNDLSTCLKTNIQLLRDGTSVESVNTHLRDWGIVLGVFADDVFESTVTMLDNDHVRAAYMLSRALEDYDIRLRYYVVQAKMVLDKYAGSRIRSPKNVTQQIAAVRDWNNGDYKLVSVLDLYDPTLWPPEIRKAMDQKLAKTQKAIQNSFVHMVTWLIANEPRVRGVIRIFVDGLLYRYRNMIPTWRMQSAFLHGDQMTISDIIEFNDQGQPSGKIFERSQAYPTTLLFSAIDNVIELIRSFGMVNSWNPGVEAIRDRAKVLWLGTRDLRPLHP